MTTTQQYADMGKQYFTAIARRGNKWFEAMLLITPDSLPTQTPGNGEPSARSIGGHGDPTFQATLVGQEYRAALAKGHEQLIMAVGNAKALVELMNRYPVDYAHAPVMEEARCSGKIDATCTLVASPHHDTDTGTLIDKTLCDDCYAAACPSCHVRPIEQYRTHCEACRKRIARDEARETQRAKWAAA